MKNIKSFESFSGAGSIHEGKGIHRAIRNKLVSFLKKNPDATFKEAGSHIADHVDGWKLSKDDFNEAKDLI